MAVFQLFNDPAGNEIHLRGGAGKIQAPTWPRSFMPTIQSKRNLIAKMKLLPVHELIEGKSLLLIDGSYLSDSGSAYS